VSVATIVEEIRRCVAWIAREGAAHGADPAHLVVSGHSAGGHLAAAMLATPAANFGTGRHPLAGAVSVSGVHDLVPMVLASFNTDLRLDDAEARRLSPVALHPASDAPILVAVGGDETSEFLRQARLLWDAWPANRPAGDEGPLVVAGRHHFSIVSDYAQADSELTRRTLARF
jgi:arylformamidase